MSLMFNRQSPNSQVEIRRLNQKKPVEEILQQALTG